MISSHKIKFGNSVAKGFLFGFLLVCVVAFPVVNQQRVSFAMSNSWASGVWTEGNPATSTKIGAYVDTYGWPGGASSPITFNVLSVTGNGYFLQLTGYCANQWWVHRARSYHLRRYDWSFRH